MSLQSKIVSPSSLSISEISRLLAPHKTIREPVHGDVLVNRLEVAIIDTKEFQRLRHHKQLGLCDMVYPGAEHSRFQHALGTLHVASLMLETVNDNAKIHLEPPALIVGDYGKLVTRLAALLHDVVNLPFGHTLEDEGLLVEKDWRDVDRVDLLFDKSSFLLRTVSEIIGREFHLDDAKLIAEKSNQIVRGLRSILTFDESQNPNFEYAYAADIVGNTFCADLLDYLERDAYFTGVQCKFRTDRSRAISYVFIPLNGRAKNRLVIRLWHHGRFKDDVISELFSILRARKDLAEAVYFHHAKVCLSAMLISAIQRSNLIGRLKTDLKPRLLELTDHEILGLLKVSESGNFANSIIDDIDNRRKYIPVYLASHQINYPPHRSSLEFDEIIQKIRDHDSGAKSRLELEDELAEFCGLTPGQVIIYCPDPKMNLKAAKARVLWETDRVAVLEDIRANNISDRISTLKLEHQSLWEFYVFADHKASEDQRKLLAAASSDRFKRDNEIIQYSNIKDARVLSIDNWALDRNVPSKEKNQVREFLLTTKARDRRRTDFLEKIGYSDRIAPSMEICDQVLQQLKTK